MNGADLDGHLNLYELSDLQPALASTGSSKLFQIFFATFKSMKKVKLKVKIGIFVAFFLEKCFYKARNATYKGHAIFD